MVTRELVQVLLRQFALARDDEHGVAHWARVLENGLLLASLTGARRSVVELFAVFSRLAPPERRRRPVPWTAGGGLRR